MKSLTKTLLSVAAITAVTTALGVSAMAASYNITGDVTGTYDSETGAVTLVGPASTGQQTLLIVAGDETTEATTTTIKQIDENDAGTAITSTVLPANLADGTYSVRIGGNGTVAKGLLTISSTPVVQTEDIMIGDVNSSNSITSDDATMISRLVGGNPIASSTAGTTRTKADDNSTITIGDVNDSNSVTSADGTMVKRYVGGNPIASSTAGQTVTVIVE